MVLILLENFCLQIQCIAVGRWGPSCASLLIYKQAVIRIIKMRRKSLGKLVKRMIYVASLPWVPSLTYLPCSFLLQIKSFERVFPGWHIELSSISLVPATHAVGSIVQYLCFREKKKKKKRHYFPLKFVCFAAEFRAVVCPSSHKWERLFVRQKITLPSLKHIPHLLISTSSVRSQTGIFCRPHQICTTLFYGSWPYMP